MKSEKILDAVGKISDELIEDAVIPFKRGKRRFPWKALVAAAACFCLLVTAACVVPRFFRNGARLYYGQVDFLSVSDRTNAGVSGQVFRRIDGTKSSGGIQADLAPPTLGFEYGSYVHIVAKAVEDMGIYEELYTYGSSYKPTEYRLFRMEVTDSLESGMEGTFYYMLPGELTGDLTQYDALLIAMYQLPKNYVLCSAGRLMAFEYLFCDPQNAPELGNMIAFTDGVFDASLWETWWQDRSRRYGYQDLGKQLDETDDDLPVSSGTTLEEALQRMQAQIEALEGSIWSALKQVRHYDFQKEAAQQTMAWVKPFENGIFVPEVYYDSYLYRRYIGGCPTNEWYSINYENETVATSEYCFKDKDFKKLPDISAYIASLDLEQIVPQHMDTAGKKLINNIATGWYEKTEDGVYAIVRISWRYKDQGNDYLEYYDETFILLDKAGDYLVSREELIELIGKNPYIYLAPYGEQIAMPMV